MTLGTPLSRVEKYSICLSESSALFLGSRAIEEPGEWREAICPASDIQLDQ